MSFAMRKVHWVRFPSLAGKEVVACDHIYICDYCYIINLIDTITDYNFFWQGWGKTNTV